MLRAGILAMLLLAMVFCGTVSAQQEPKYYQYTTNSGLLSNDIYSIHKAASGLLYIAHAKGLSSFDGRNFIHYPNARYPFSELTNITETRAGRIYCKSFNNVLYELDSQGALCYLRPFPVFSGLSPAAAHNNTVYNLRHDTVIAWNTTTNTDIRLLLRPGYRPPMGNVIFAGNVRYGNDDAAIWVNDRQETGLLPASYNHFSWHIGSKGVFGARYKKAAEILDLNTGETMCADSSGVSMVNYIECTDSNIWVCTTNGVHHRKRSDRGGTFTHLLKGHNVTSVAEIGDNSMVAGTLSAGLLHILNFHVRAFTGLPGDISSMTGQRGALLLGTNDGRMLSVNTTTGKLTSMPSTGSSPVCFLLQHDNKLFAESDGIVNHVDSLSSIKDYTIVNGTLLLATSRGVFLHNTGHPPGWLMKFVNGEKSGHFMQLSFSDEHTSSIEYDPTLGKLYVNNYSGLFEMDTTGTGLKQMPEPGCVLKDVAVYKGRLYLASKDKGLLVYNGHSYEQSAYAASVQGILYRLFVSGDELWVLGEQALYCIGGNTVQQFHYNIGLNPSDIKDVTVDSTNVFIREAGAVISFPKHVLSQGEYLPGFLLHRVSHGSHTIAKGEEISVDNNRLVFLYSFITLGRSHHYHAAYSLNGGEAIPLPLNTNRLELNYLRPGTYDLAFYIAGNGQLRKTCDFSFTIVPRFYNTRWFYTLLFTLFCLLVFLYNRRRIRTLRAGFELQQAKLLLEKELDKSVLTSIRAQMNPHFLFNALNTIQSFVYMNDKRSAGIYISKFSELTRRILDDSSKEYVALSEEVSVLKLYLELEKMRFEGVLEYEVFVDPKINTAQQAIPPMLLQPYVENAIKHGLFHKKQNRQLSVRFLWVAEGVQIEIEDNGIGRRKSEELNRNRNKGHQSFSMNANKKRLEILRQQQPNIRLEITDRYSDLGEALGTTVVIVLPHHTL